MASTQLRRLQRKERGQGVGKVLALVIAGLALTTAGCGINGQQVQTQYVILTSPPTVTVAPIVSMTPRFTATLIPTATPIPTETLPASLTPTPFIPTTAPTATPIPAVRGTVRSTANFRVGPGRDFEAQDQLSAGTELTILSYNDTREWFLVRLDDGRNGWIQSNLVDATDEAAVQVLPPPQLTAVAMSTLPPAPPTAVPTLVWRTTRTGDILAYCDLPAFAASAANKVIRAGAEVTIYWTWEASTPEQIQDQLDYGQYEVKLNGQTLDEWRNYRTGVHRFSATRFEVKWLIPVGQLEAGEYTLDYKLTWTQRVEDGTSSFGPGGEQETNVGSCKFTVR